MLILLPPSEGKTAPLRGRPLDLETLTFPALTPTRERLADALVDLSAGDPARATATLGIGHTQHELLGRNAALRTAPTARADRLYSGVLYDALELGSLSPAGKRRAASWVTVTSALFGLVRPGDRIPAYRLSGGTTLPGVGAVAGVWREALPGVVEDAVGHGLLVDLRSTAYAAFWRPPAALAERVVSVRVLHEAGGKRSVVSHFNKATKGRIVRAVLEDGGAPLRPAAFAAQLRDLGWTVEEGEPTRTGTRLDVVVKET